MARAKSVSCLIALLVSSAAAQSSTSSIPSTSIPIPPTSVQSASPVTPSPGDSTTQDIPDYLWSIATSLLTRYYPSTTITNIATLSWPGTVVIGHTTYTIHHPGVTNSAKKTGETTSSETTSSKTKSIQSATATGVKSQAAKSPHDTVTDKRLAIIIGVVIGLVALLIMAVLFFCLWRRRRRTGSFFMSRRSRSPSTLSSGSWVPGRPDSRTFGTTTYVSGGYPSQREPKLPRVSIMPQRKPVPMTMHPALQEQSSRSTSDDNPFYTPQERSTTRLNPQELDSQQIQHVELDHYEPAQRRSSSSVRDGRPPTPFSPMMMMQMPGPASKPKLHVNPFTSPEDAEADDVVSPIVPTRSPERRNSPMVHYPSWDEVSEFNFSGDERDRHAEDGGDGWRPTRRRTDGRYELA